MCSVGKLNSNERLTFKILRANYEQFDISFNTKDILYMIEGKLTYFQRLTNLVAMTMSTNVRS